MVRDLLTKKGRDLDLRNKGTSGEPVVAGLREVETMCTSEVMKLLNEGNQRRISEPTAANRVSSRSHAILKVNKIMTIFTVSRDSIKVMLTCSSCSVLVPSTQSHTSPVVVVF